MLTTTPKGISDQQIVTKVSFTLLPVPSTPKSGPPIIAKIGDKTKETHIGKNIKIFAFNFILVVFYVFWTMPLNFRPFFDTLEAYLSLPLCVHQTFSFLISSITSDVNPPWRDFTANAFEEKSINIGMPLLTDIIIYTHQKSWQQEIIIMMDLEGSPHTLMIRRIYTKRTLLINSISQIIHRT